MKKRTLTILMADDDQDDRYLTQSAFEESRVPCEMHFVEDGSEVFDFLEKRGKFDGTKAELPSLILLDLNMPRKDGRQVLAELRASLDFRHIPVVIFTNSKSPEEVRQLYRMGASSYITKPASFDQLLDVARNIGKYWSDTVTL